MAQIRVTGTGRATSAPDEAAFTFNCQGFAADAPDALAQATTAAESVLGLLDRLGVAPEQRGMQRARVHPRTRWVNEQEMREGWDAYATVECTLAQGSDGAFDATVAFELLEQVTAIDRVAINGPHWRIRQDNPAHDTARQRAVDDGRNKAQSYATAAGLTLGDLQELNEGGSEGPRPMMRGMAMAETSGLEAADQSVDATITLVFDAH